MGGEEEQAQNMQTSFDLLLPDLRISLAVWFCLKDFPNGYYGLFRQSGLSEEDKKPAWRTFNAIATGEETPTPTQTPIFTPTPTPTPSIDIDGEIGKTDTLSHQPSSEDALNGIIAEKISGGFHEITSDYDDREPAFTDGAGLEQFTGLLRDFPGENTPAWAGFWNLSGGAAVDLTEVRVFSGNAGREGRIFQHYDIYTTGDAEPASDSNWEMLGEEVTCCDFGTDNYENEYEASLTVLTPLSGDYMATDVTGVRIDFYSVSGTNSLFEDDWDPGGEDDRDDMPAAFESPLIYEVDAWFVTPTPTETPPPTPTPTQTVGPTPTPTATPTPTPTPHPANSWALI